MSSPFQAKPPTQPALPPDNQARVIPFNPAQSAPEAMAERVPEPLPLPESLPERDVEDEARNLRRLNRRRGAGVGGIVAGGMLLALGAAALWLYLPFASRDASPLPRVTAPASVVLAPVPALVPAPVPAPVAVASAPPPSVVTALPQPVQPAPAPVIVAPNPQPSAPPPPVPAAPQAQAPTEPPSTAAPAAPSGRPRLPDAEVALLIERGQRLIREQRDVTAARPFLIRAEQGGSARAAYLLAETFDPAMLEIWNIRSVRPDVARARALYARALESGITEARTRLDRLPN